MLFSGIKQIAVENNWYAVNNNAIGLYHEYFFQIEDGLVSKKMLCYYSEIDENTRQAIREKILEKKNELHIGEIDIKNGLLCITFSEKYLPIKKDILQNRMDYVCEILRSILVQPVNKCSACNCYENVNYYYSKIAGTIKMVCRDCVDKDITNGYKLDSMKKLGEKKYLRGITGSLLFSLVGIALWVAMAFYLHTLTSVGAFIIGFLSFFGYKYFKGTMNNNAKWILMSIIIVSIVLSNLLYPAAEIYSKYEGIAFSDILNMLFNNEKIISYIINTTVLSLLLSAIPLVFMIIFIDKEMNLSKWILAEKINI